MAIIQPMDMVLQLKFEAAIQDHVAKKATSRRAKAAAREKATHLRSKAQRIEDARAFLCEPGDTESPAAG